MALTAILAILLVGGCLSAPADDPIRIDLPVYDQPQAGLPVYDQPQADSQVLISQPLDPENYPGGEPLNKNTQGSDGNIVSYKLQAASSLFGNALDAKASAHQGAGGLFSPSVSTLESALQESEGYGSKTLSFKENIQNMVAGIFQPKPIVDTIREEEKYGNTGDKFASAGKALVGGAESFSNFINSVLEVPGSVFKQIARVATEKLNNLGGKLIGL